ncbi:MAG TPA: hypothetical protein VIA09_01050 [Nitrososphaeraceae archaeon]|jgi:hypothetical protein
MNGSNADAFELLASAAGWSPLCGNVSGASENCLDIEGRIKIFIN